MADLKISALPASTTPLAGSEVLPIVQSSTTKQVSVANLTAGRAVSALSFAAGNLSVAGNEITSSTGSVNLRPASNGFATIGANANANWANSVRGLSAGDFYSLSADNTNSNSFGLASNAYRTASGTPGTWAYAGVSTATLYNQDRGRHYFYSAISGSLNGAITWIPVISTAATGGDVTINTGNLVIGTSGKGIDFSADGQAAGMTSELLDDYEEGDWTPVLTGSTSGSITFSTLGRYTKVGNIVTIELYDSNIDASTPLVGNITLTGIPFSVFRLSPASVFYANLFGVTNLYAAVVGSSVSFTNNANSTSVLTESSVSALSGRRLALSCTYRV